MSITREKLKKLMEWEDKVRGKIDDTKEKYCQLGNQEKDAIHNSIISFLERNKDRVFTQREIAAALTRDTRDDNNNNEKKFIIYIACAELSLSNQIELVCFFSKGRYYYGHKQHIIKDGG